jgi:predicted 2-oxoglutarate/Fe(II)-dependent dioxygenase YbiX
VDAEVFTHFGMYIQRNFLSADECRLLLADAKAAKSRPATVREGSSNVVDAEYRKSRVAHLSADAAALLTGKLEALRPTLEGHFQAKTTGCREPEALIYKPGDFFKAHADNVPSGTAESDAVVTGRVISTIVFLNGESEAPEEGSFMGGTLGFFGLMDDPRMTDREFGLTGEPGLLVAFRPEIVHRIAPVTHGERCTIVTWFEN